MTNEQLTEQSMRVVANHCRFSNERDWSRIEALYADDVVLEEAEGHPFPGLWRGKAAVREAGGGVVSSLSLTNVSPRETMGTGGRVATLIDITMTDKDGKSFVHELVILWTVNDAGKITEIRPYYFDLVALRQRLGLD
jgi:ketosteroid isomerase-like protein